MPNRIIKDSIHTSETVSLMTDFQFRLWVNLITYVDDFGRGDARPEVIKGFCFPLMNRLSTKAIDDALSELARIGSVSLYSVDGRPYLCFPKWESHQAVRNKKSKYPAPTETCTQLKSIEINCNQLNANVPVIQSNTNPNSNPNNSVRDSRFVPPTVDEVREYCQERNNNVDPQKFVDYYTSKGWKVGREKMVDYKAAIRNWERNDFGNDKKQYLTRQYSEADFAAMETNIDDITDNFGM